MDDLISHLLALLLCYGLFHLARYVYRDITTPLRIRDLPGPTNPSLLNGNYNEMVGDHCLTDKWRERFGRNFKFMGMFNIRELHTSDPKALTHIAYNPALYQKSSASRYNIRRLFGNGILATEGDEHKLQAAFSPQNIQTLTPIFNRHADHLRDLWAANISQQDGAMQIDVLSWLRRMTLDSIGEAGFNYQFHSLEPTGQQSEFMEAMTQMVHSPGAQNNFLVRFAQATFPILRILPLPESQVFSAARKKMTDVGFDLLAQSKAYIEAAGGKRNVEGHQDLLSTLIMANSDLPVDQRLSDKDIAAQVPNFVVAGHENTSAGMAWALQALSTNQQVQRKLRAELLSCRSESPSYDELNGLGYLENVVRETMRLYPPAEYIGRVASADDILPLSEPFVDKMGKIHQSIPIPKGQKIHIPLRAVNIDRSLWGDDAHEFKPERWNNLPEAVRAIPSIYANLLTFYAGPHSCLGYRYSILEQKAILFSLVRAFEFENVFPPEAMGRTSVNSLPRPIVLAERAKGTQMPLMVRLYRG
ncbi:cytochrome P450 [Mycena floridula]|nr:cytochrome P450 [Mycena floridula]